uniref:Uncharacterized protein n=1 Tax=Megaviridae environmental sample TaxID=1737588 RepID=A0A5J6VNL0_9VIRU|nr:MAG: hypothetical protein [Megaviridae environmental sample]
MSNHCNSTTLSTIKFDPSLSCLNSCNKTKLKDDLKSVLKMVSSDTQTPQLVSTIHQNILHNVDLNSNALKTDTTTDPDTLTLNYNQDDFKEESPNHLSLKKPIDFDFNNSIVSDSGLAVEGDKLKLNVQHSEFKIIDNKLSLHQEYITLNDNDTYTFNTKQSGQTLDDGGVSIDDNSSLQFHNNSIIKIDNNTPNNANSLNKCESTAENTQTLNTFKYFIGINKCGNPKFLELPAAFLNEGTLDNLTTQVNQLEAEYNCFNSKLKELEEKLNIFLPSEYKIDIDINTTMCNIIGMDTNICCSSSPSCGSSSSSGGAHASASAGNASACASA